MHRLMIILLSFLVAYAFFQQQNGPTRFHLMLKRNGYLDKKVPLSEMQGDSIMIMLTLGQSNACNSGEKKYKPRHTGKVLNYYDGELYQATDPLIGADGTGGSVWGRLADILIDSGCYKKVVIIPIGMGSTTIDCWAAGECLRKLKTVLADLTKRNIKCTHIMYHQGESENSKMAGQDYKNRLNIIYSIIRTYQTAPFFVGITSYSSLCPINNGIDTMIQQAQSSFVAEKQNVFRGPNTDSLVYAIDRFDGQHFSEIGMCKHAIAWFRAIKNSKEL